MRKENSIASCWISSFDLWLFFNNHSSIFFLSKKRIFPELLQEEFTMENIQVKMAEVDINKETIVSLLNEERKKLGTNGVIEKIAIYLLERIQ